MLPVLMPTVQEWVQARTQDDTLHDRYLELRGLDALVEVSCVEVFARVLNNTPETSWIYDWVVNEGARLQAEEDEVTGVGWLSVKAFLERGSQASMPDSFLH